jgi:hypothetical protein
MSTCVFYVDESGDVRRHHVPLRSGETPLFTLTGLALPLAEWRNIDRDYLALKRQFFAPELARTTRRHEHFDIKGNTLAAPRNRDSRRRQVFMTKICELVARYESRLFCVTTIKNLTNPTPATSIYTSSLQYLVERFNIFISEHSQFDKGIIIIDKNVRFEWPVAASHMSFIFGSETGRLLTNIYEAPLFADSRLTVGLQVVDNLSSMIFTNHYGYYCRNVQGAPSYYHMRNHWPAIDLLEFKSRRRHEGHLKYGFRVIRHDR